MNKSCSFLCTSNVSHKCNSYIKQYLKELITCESVNEFLFIDNDLSRFCYKFLDKLKSRFNLSFYFLHSKASEKTARKKFSDKNKHFKFRKNPFVNKNDINSFYYEIINRSDMVLFYLDKKTSDLFYDFFVSIKKPFVKLYISSNLFLVYKFNKI